MFEPVEKPHRLITALVRSMRKAKPDRWGAARFDHQAGMIVHIESVERSISILDRAMRTLEEKGFTLEVREGGILVALGQDDLSFAISERTRRETHEPTEAEQSEYERQEQRRERAQRRGDWSALFTIGSGKPWPEFDTIYTGQLVFSIDGVWADGMRKTWADGKTQTVEKLFDQIITGIEAILAYEKARREEREEQDRRRAEMQHRRKLAKKRSERENARLEFLHELVAMQREAAELRAWLSQTGLTETRRATGTGDLDRMIAWSRQRLAKLEAATTPDSVSGRLSENGLFPEVDELHDPLGDPPAPRNYWDY